MEKVKLTQKQIFIGGLILTYEKGATCYQLIKDYAKELKENGISIDKINSVNATLASLASKDLVVKTKVAYNDKMVTNYTPNQALKDLLSQKKKTKSFLLV